MLEYLKNSIYPNGFIFLQETHSSNNDEKRWCDKLNSNLYFSHRKSNLCSVAIGYVASKSFILANQTADKNGCLLLIDAIVDDVKFVLKKIFITIILNHNNYSHWPSYTKSYKMLAVTEIRT